MRKSNSFTKVYQHGLLCAFIPALIVCLTLLLSSKLNAQVAYGINGTVIDANGAAVPGANVTASNKATGVVSRAITSGAGAYVIILSDPGHYSVTVEASGFKKVVHADVTVDIGRFSAVPTTLVPGATSQTVHVSGQAISLNTTDPSIGTTVPPELVQASPVEVSGGPRQIDSFVLQGPGAGQPNSVSAEGHNGAFNINGGITELSSNYYNGIPVSVTALSTGVPLFPPYELVSQFHVTSSTFSAQYGLAQGVITYKTKSGTNELHGDAFDILRNSFFDSDGFFPSHFNAAKKPIPPTNHQNDWGFTVGGPIVIPKLYNGKNRSFFVFSLDWYGQNQGQTGFGTVPTAAEKNGDFSRFLNSAGNQIPIFDPETGLQFPGNIIPTSRFSPISASILNLIPDPNRAGTVFGQQQNELPAVNSVKNFTHTWGFTLDHNLTKSQSLHFTYWNDRTGSTGLGSNIVPLTNPLQSGNINTQTASGYLLNYVDVIRPHLVMTAGVSKIDPDYKSAPLLLGSTFAGVVDTLAFPGIGFGGQNPPSNWGNVKTIGSSRVIHFSVVNNWLWTLGRHNLNIGWELRRSIEDTYDCNTCGSRTNFSNVETSTPNNGPGFTSNGSSFASYLLGSVDNVVRTNSEYVKLRNLAVSPYIQDNWQATNRLTISAGLRWDVLVPLNTVDDNIVFTDFNAPNAAAGGLLGAATKYGNCTGCTGTHRADIHWANLGPRLGFSYMVNNKTVVQAGFYKTTLSGGSYEFAASRFSQDYGKLLAGALAVGGTGTNAPGYGSWDANPIPNPPATPFSPSIENKQIAMQLDPKTSGIAPYQMQWTFGIQRQLPWNMMAMVAFVGNRDIHLPSMLNEPNQLNPRYLSLGTLLGKLVTSPEAVAAGIKIPYPNFVSEFGPNATVEQALLPYPQFQGTNNHFDQSGVSQYKGVQFNLAKRFTNNISFLTNLTLSHNQSNVDYGVTLQGRPGINTFDQKLEWSTSMLNQKYAYKFIGTYKLPIGPGQRFLGSRSIASRILGGWQVAGILDYFGGNPIPFFQKNFVLMATNIARGGVNRPNVVPGVKRKTFSYEDTKEYFEKKRKTLPIQFTTNAFTPSPFYGLGNAKRGYSSIVGPGYAMENFDAMKSFPLAKSILAILRVDYFNAFNRTQLQLPDGVIDDSTFGMVTKQSSQISNRQGQVTFRIEF